MGPGNSKPAGFRLRSGPRSRRACPSRSAGQWRVGRAVGVSAKRGHDRAAQELPPADEERHRQEMEVGDERHAMANDSRNPSAERRRTWPRNFSNSISRDARKSTKPSPMRADDLDQLGRRRRGRARTGRRRWRDDPNDHTEGRRTRGANPWEPFRFARTSLCLRVTCRTAGRAARLSVGWVGPALAKRRAWLTVGARRRSNPAHVAGLPTLTEHRA
jgi:hypothetical protein